MRSSIRFGVIAGHLKVKALACVRRTRVHRARIEKRFVAAELLSQKRISAVDWKMKYKCDRPLPS